MEWMKSDQMQAVIKEYCIGKISSAIECGPFMKKYFGFDIAVFNNRIEFAMEKCEAIT